MRTTSGWMLIQRLSSIEAPVAVPPWSDCIAYSLQRPSPVPVAKPEERLRKPAAEGDRLEQLAHLGRAHQPVCLVGERQESPAVLRWGARHHLGDAAVDQELRLARVSADLEAAFARRGGHCAEV